MLYFQNVQVKGKHGVLIRCKKHLPQGAVIVKTLAESGGLDWFGTVNYREHLHCQLDKKSTVATTAAAQKAAPVK